MSTLMDDEIKRWTARRKAALVLEIIQGKTTVAEASRAHDLPPSEIELWVEDGKKGMENALRANPQDVREGPIRKPSGSRPPAAISRTMRSDWDTSR
jgi:transposase-like protein